MGGSAMGRRADGAGWMVDPTGRFTYRYHDGTGWTRHVIRDGVPSLDPPDSTDPPGEEVRTSRPPR